ncbi:MULTISPECIES: nucleoside deaminase [Acinetobacter]|uniref:Nucleoside deaminase n=1 Tax=Acinetobacter chengduensis TaxID=2420890 RepID=A0ABX9TXU8_9GAMM|nr:MULTISPECIES: nucleoside deaminase [Acinetobacter]MBI1452282.1 nucleoside deaminase [Acinetobacter sp. FL51]RKG43269.1 nucleoside deaminase [Acinetobacter sp. WCHAc060007]RLL23110.1 nucleoside deaminase [Acinetobacter chengduensis]
MKKPTQEQIIKFLKISNEVAQRAISLGHHPFGAVLVAPDHETVLLTQCNIDTVNHAESTLARVACSNYTPEFLWNCTLYTSVEPCCMCAGTIYWANIGRVVFAMTEEKLLACTANHGENPTMSIPASYVFKHGQKDIELIGPIEELEPEIMQVQAGFWATR